MPGVTTFYDLLGENLSNIYSSNNNQPQLKESASTIAYITWEDDNNSKLDHLNAPKSFSPKQIEQIKSACDGRPLKNIGVRLIGNNVLDHFGLKVVSIKNKSNSNLNHHIAGDNYFHTLLKTDNQETILKNISSNEEELTISQFKQDLTLDKDLGSYRCKSDSVTGMTIIAAGTELISKLGKQQISGSDVDVFFITKEMKNMMQEQVEERTKTNVGNFQSHIDLPKIEEFKVELVPLNHESWEKMSTKSIKIANQKTIAAKSDQKIDNTVTLQFELFY